jgi:hypothetical protein
MLPRPKKGRPPCPCLVLLVVLVVVTGRRRPVVEFERIVRVRRTVKDGDDRQTRIERVEWQRFGRGGGGKGQKIAPVVIIMTIMIRSVRQVVSIRMIRAVVKAVAVARQVCPSKVAVRTPLLLLEEVVMSVSLWSAEATAMVFFDSLLLLRLFLWGRLAEVGARDHGGRLFHTDAARATAWSTSRGGSSYGVFLPDASAVSFRCSSRNAFARQLLVGGGGGDECDGSSCRRILATDPNAVLQRVGHLLTRLLKRHALPQAAVGLAGLEKLAAGLLNGLDDGGLDVALLMIVLLRDVTVGVFVDEVWERKENYARLNERTLVREPMMIHSTKASKQAVESFLSIQVAAFEDILVREWVDVQVVFDESAQAGPLVAAAQSRRRRRAEWHGINLDCGLL